MPAPLAPAGISSAARARRRFGVAIGRQGFWLLIFGLVWLIPAFVDRRFVVAMFAWDAVVLAAWAIDLSRLPPPGALAVQRTWLDPAALSVESRVRLTVSNRSARPLRIRMLDAVPARLRATPPDLALSVPGHGDVDAEYAIHPAARGATPVGEAYLRYQSPLRLAERWASADLSQTIVAYPNLEEAKRHSVFLIRSRQIEQEKRLARVRGMGRAFESLREYRDGDEVRHICWTASARRGKLVTRLYEIERSQTVWTLIDCGRLMRARVAGLSKLDYAVNAALSLAQVAINSGDRVGVLAYGRRTSAPLAAGRGAAHLKQIVDHLALVQEDEWEADHLQAAGRLLTDQKRRSLVVWITDLAETAMTPEVVRAASALMARHVVVFLVIGEPDVQTVARRMPRSVEQMYESAAAQEMLQRRERLLARLREGGAIALETTAASLSLTVVNSYLEVKQRNRL